MGKRIAAAGLVAAIAAGATLMRPTSPELTPDAARAGVEQGYATMDELGPAVSAYLLQIDCTIPPTVLPCRDPQLAEQLIREGGHTVVALHSAQQIAHAPAWDQAAGERAVTAVHDSIAGLQALTETPTFRATASAEARAVSDTTRAKVRALAQ